MHEHQLTGEERHRTLSQRAAGRDDADGQPRTAQPGARQVVQRGNHADAEQAATLLADAGRLNADAAVTALQKSDLIVALGARFDDRVTGNLESFAPNAKVVHADIDPAEIGKNRAVDVPIVGDAREVIADLVVALQAEADAGQHAQHHLESSGNRPRISLSGDGRGGRRGVAENRHARVMPSTGSTHS